MGCGGKRSGKRAQPELHFSKIEVQFRKSAVEIKDKRFNFDKRVCFH
jgi:hypothetical protein